MRVDPVDSAETTRIRPEPIIKGNVIASKRIREVALLKFGHRVEDIEDAGLPRQRSAASC